MPSRPPVAGVAIAVLAVVAATAAHVFVAWGSTGPVFYTDEIGYLFNAARLAGVGAVPQLDGGSYYLGWSVVLAPAWWISSDPEVVYRIALTVSVVFGVAVIAPLATLARQLGLALPWAVVAGAAVSVAPSRLVMSNFALAENFIAFLVATAAVLAMRFARRARAGDAVALVACASVLFLTHARTAPVLVAALLWVGFRCRRQVRTLLLSAGTALVLCVPGFLLYRAIVSPMYQDAVSNREERGLDRLLGIDLAAAGTAFTGQVWYLFVAWYGLALLGVLMCLRRAVAELRARRPDVALAALVALAGILAVSVVWVAAPIARGDLRLDLYTYGRYLDTIVFLFALVGMVGVAQGLGRRMWVAWAATGVAVSVLFVAIVRWQIPSGPGIWWGPNSVAGLIQWPWPLITPAGRTPWIEATVATFLLGLVLGVIARFVVVRLRAGLTVLLVLVVFLASGIAAERVTIRPSFDGWYTSFTLRHDIADTLERYPEATIAFDRRGLSGTLGGADTVSRNAYQYWSMPRALPVLDSTTEPVTTDLVISRSDWPEAQALGALRVAVDTGLFDNALWVLPGPVQDRMIADGAVVP